jgi:cytochrome c biogenesis protein CcmG/thiol:disulfide interchange protein DsbE
MMRGLRITPLRAGLALAVTAGLVAGLGFGLSRDPRVLAPAVLDHPAPRFTLERLGGGRMTLPRAGRPLVVNFWASWCPPCRIEFPLLHEAWRRWGNRVQFAGVLYRNSASGARAFLVRMGDPPDGSYPNLIDPGSNTAIDFGVYGLPETFFIDRYGVIRAKVIGEISWSELEQNVGLIRR